MTKWINRSVVAAPRNGTTSHTITFTAASAGSLLVLVMEGAVTHTVPTGWTRQAQSLVNTELSVYTKTATANETSFSTTHNGSNYPVHAVVYEFAAGSTFSGAVSGNNGANGAANPNLTGLTGTNLLFGAVGQMHSTLAVPSAPTGVTWTGTGSPVEDLDVVVPGTAATDGYVLSLAYVEDSTATSFQPTGSIANVNSNFPKEALTFAVKAVAAPTVTLVASGSVVLQGTPSGTITVPAGVTAQHLAVLQTTTADSNLTNVTVTGFTQRYENPTGQNNHAVSVHTRMGLVAGDTITVAQDLTQVLRASVVFLDTQGRDVAVFGGVGTRAGTSQAFAVAPSIAVTALTQDVLLLGTERTTATGSVISSVSPASATQLFFAEYTENASSHYVGTFVPTATTVPAQTITWNSASGNATALMMALAAPTEALPITEPFTGTTGAAWPTRWTSAAPTVGVSSIQGNRGRLETPATVYGTAKRVLSTMPAVTDTDVTVTVYPVTTGFQWAFLQVQANGVGGADWVPASGYMLWGDSGGGTYNAYLVRYNGDGSETALSAEVAGPAWSSTNGVKIRMQVTGRVVRYKTWAGNTSEPASWTSEVIDSGAPLPAGKVALLNVADADALTARVDWDDLTVSTPAPVPVAQYLGNGSTADAIAGGSAGVLTNGATYATGIVPAYGGQAFEVDGTNDYVSIADQDKLDLTNNFSLEAWFYADTLTGFGSIITKGSDYGIQHNGTSLGLLSDGTPSVVRLYSPTAITTGTLYHVAAVFGGGTAKLYVNGVEKGSTAFTSSYTNTQPLRIGSFDGASEYFDGRIARVGVYGRVLSASEVAALYSAGTVTDTTAPTVPGSVSAVADGPTQVTITWTASTDANGVASYRVRRGGVDVSGATALTGLTFTNTGLTASTQYSYTVSAVDAAGNRSAESTASVVTTPAASSYQVPTSETIWQSAIGTTTMSLGTMLTAPNVATVARGVVSLASDLSNPIVSSNEPALSSTGGWVNFQFTALTANTVYYTGIRVNGALIPTGRGTFRTLKSSLAAAKVIAGSCNVTGSNHAVFTRIKTEAPDFMVHMGDIHYADLWGGGTGYNNTTWRAALRSTLISSTFKPMLETVPMMYDPDNHDGPGASAGYPNGTWEDPVNANVRQLTGEIYAATTKGFYKTWVHAGVRYIELDRWSFRSDPAATESAGKTMLGATQRAWFINLLQTATEPAIIVFAGFPHYSDLTAGGRWGSYSTERVTIGNALTALPLVQRNKIVFIGGDSHSLNADDGTNAMWNLPSLNASPFNQSGAGAGGGTWNIINVDADDTRGYFSRLTFTPDADSLNFTWEAVRDDGAVQATWSKEFPLSANVRPVWVKQAAGTAFQTYKRVKP